MKLKLKGASEGMDYATSMTDLSFLLIVFFMIAAVFVADEGILLKLPSDRDKPVAFDASSMVVLRLEGPAGATVDGAEVPGGDPAALSGLVRAALGGKRSSTVLLVSGAGVSYQRVMDAVAACRSAGGSAFSLISEETRPVPIDLGGKGER